MSCKAHNYCSLSRVYSDSSYWNSAMLLTVTDAGQFNIYLFNTNLSILDWNSRKGHSLLFIFVKIFNNWAWGNTLRQHTVNFSPWPFACYLNIMNSAKVHSLTCRFSDSAGSMEINIYSFNVFTAGQSVLGKDLCWDLSFANPLLHQACLNATQRTWNLIKFKFLIISKPDLKCPDIPYYNQLHNIVALNSMAAVTPFNGSEKGEIHSQHTS